MKKKPSSLTIKSPKMHKSLNSSSERMFIKGSTINIKRKSPKLKSKSPSSKKKSPKKVSFAHSLNKLEEKIKTLYGPNNIFDLPTSENFIPSQPMIKKQIVSSPKSNNNTKVCNSKCNILTNQCYIDCINYITTNISEYTKNPNSLVDDLYVMIEPRMNKDVYIKNINTANLYNNMVDYTAQKWNDDDIKTIKGIVKLAKENIHYKPVKMFLKEVKFYKYYK